MTYTASFTALAMPAQLPLPPNSSLQFPKSLSWVTNAHTKAMFWITRKQQKSAPGHLARTSPTSALSLAPPELCAFESRTTPPSLAPLLTSPAKTLTSFGKNTTIVPCKNSRVLSPLLPPSFPSTTHHLTPSSLLSTPHGTP